MIRFVNNPKKLSSLNDPKQKTKLVLLSTRLHKNPSYLAYSSLALTLDGVLY